MQFEAERAYLLAHFQEYRIIQPTVIFLHGLPTALSRKNTLANELQRIGCAIRINVQTAGKDFFTAFVQFEQEVAAGLAIMALDGRQLMNRRLRVFYGSTKFCPHFLRGHLCRLQDCNYAHFFHPALTHLKDQAKDIDHQNIANMFLVQNCSATQLVLSALVKPQVNSRKFLLPIDADHLALQFGITREPFDEGKEGQERNAERQEEKGERQLQGEKVVMRAESQWGALSAQIESEVLSGGELQGQRSRIQLFLDGAERFLSKLIFQSSGFIF